MFMQDGNIRRLVTDGASLDISKPFSGLVYVSSETASRWIKEFNIDNRRLRKSFVEYLQKAIPAGEWQSDHPQPIVFSDKKRLIDGQHRLYAIVGAGVGVVVNMVCGARDELRKYIDTGIPRDLGDRVAFVDGDTTLNSHITVIVVAVFKIDTNRGNGKPTPNEAIAVFNANREAILFAANHRARKYLPGINRAGVMAAIVHYFQRNAQKAAEFCAGLFSPASTVQPAARLREHLISSDGSRSGSGALYDSYGKAVYAMMRHRDGVEVKAMRSAKWD